MKKLAFIMNCKTKVKLRHNTHEHAHLRRIWDAQQGARTHKIPLKPTINDERDMHASHIDSTTIINKRSLFCLYFYSWLWLFTMPTTWQSSLVLALYLYIYLSVSVSPCHALICILNKCHCFQDHFGPHYKSLILFHLPHFGLLLKICVFVCACACSVKRVFCQ